MRNGFRFIRIGRRYEFAAAHALPRTPASHKCHHLHGHNYVVDVELRGEVNRNLSGWLEDFGVIDKKVKPILAQLDHKTLNDIIDNPTAEEVAFWILDQLRFSTTGGLPWFSVTVWENARSWAQATHSEGSWPVGHRS